MSGINQRDDAVESEFSPDFIIHEKRLCNRPRIGKTSRFHQHVIKFVSPLHQIAEHPDQIAPNGAADTTVGHFKDFLISIDDKTLINTNLSVFIFDHSNFLAVLLTQNFVQQRCFA